MTSATGPVNDSSVDPKLASQSVFVTTRWSVVLSARDKSSKQSAEALETLCHTYWYPLYAFVRRQGRSPHDAQDLTQEFFARLLAKDYLQAVDQEKGRFRTFLLVALKRFLANEWDKAHAQKRGGGQPTVPLDTEMAERRYHKEGAETFSADRIYERRWALTMLDRALARLRDEFVASGRENEFEHLKQHLTADRGEIPYAEIASVLSMNEGTVRVAVHRMRKRFRELFREEIAQTVEGPEEIEDEVRHLMRALAG